MTYAAIPGGIWFPDPWWRSRQLGTWVTTQRLDATGEACHISGKVMLPSYGQKTFSAAGGGKIWVGYSSSSVFVSGSTVYRVGLQDTATGTSDQNVRGDGVWDVYADVNGGSGYDNVFQATTMTTGSKTLTHGDQVTIALEMTTRGGSDILDIEGIQVPLGNTSVMTLITSGPTYAVSTNMAVCLLEFGDGTYGWIEHSLPIRNQANSTHSTSSTFDEHGFSFQVPVPVMIDACSLQMAANAYNKTYVISLWEDPYGTPVELFTQDPVATEAVPSTTNMGWELIHAFSPIVLKAGVTYGVSMRATSTNAVSVSKWSITNSAHRIAIPGGSTYQSMTRDNDTGAFTADSTTITIGAVRICQIAGVSPSFQLGL